jgi:four helix bundle protein
MAIESFQDIVAWQRAIDLADAIYDATKSWPADERFGLTMQTRRAAVSVMAIIAEGHGRSGAREFHHHCSIADGSLSEVEALLTFAHRRGFIAAPTMNHLTQQIAETRRQLR